MFLYIASIRSPAVASKYAPVCHTTAVFYLEICRKLQAHISSSKVKIGVLCAKAAPSYGVPWYKDSDFL